MWVVRSWENESFQEYTAVSITRPLGREAFRLSSVQFSSVSQSCPTLRYPVDCSTLGLPVLQHLPELAQTQVHWVSDTIQPSVIPLSSCFQSFPASESFLRSQLFTSGGQSIGASSSGSVLLMNIQDRLRIKGRVLCPKLPGFIYFSLKLRCLFEIQD